MLADRHGIVLQNGSATRLPSTPVRWMLTLRAIEPVSQPSRCGRALGRVDELSLATGPLVTDVYKGGAVVTQRADLMIGGGSSAAEGLHLVVWGRGSTRAGSAVDMVIGIPADTLARLGIKARRCTILSEQPCVTLEPARGHVHCLQCTAS